MPKIYDSYTDEENFKKISECINDYLSGNDTQLYYCEKHNVNYHAFKRYWLKYKDKNKTTIQTIIKNKSDNKNIFTNYKSKNTPTSKTNNTTSSKLKDVSTNKIKDTPSSNKNNKSPIYNVGLTDIMDDYANNNKKSNVKYTQSGGKKRVDLKSFFGVDDYLKELGAE